MSDLLKLRDTLLERKTIQQQAKVAAAKAADNIKELVGNLSEDVLVALSELGFDMRGLVSVDYDRLISETEYLESYKSKIEDATCKLEEQLKERLDV